MHTVFFYWKGSVPGGFDGALVGLGNELLHRIGLVSLHELCISGIILVLFTGRNDHDGERIILSFQEDALIFRAQSGTHHIVHGDDGGGDVIEAAGELGSFQLTELEIFRIFRDICRSCGIPDALFQTDQAGFLKELKAAALIGGVIGDGNDGPSGMSFTSFTELL